MQRSKLEDNYAFIYNAMEKYELTFLKEIDNLICKMWPSIYDVTLKVAFLERRLDKPALEAKILIPTFCCSVPTEIASYVLSLCTPRSNIAMHHMEFTMFYSFLSRTANRNVSLLKVIQKERMNAKSCFDYHE